MSDDYDGPERRERSARWATVERVWRNLVPLLAVGLAAWAVFGVQTRSEQIGRLAKENTARIAEAEEAHDALCVLRADLERRVESSRAFLEEHPAGIAGIPAKVIRDGIRNQQRTINALDRISC